MSNSGIRAKQKRRFVSTTDSNHRLKVVTNLLNHQFDAIAPNKVWASDITYIPTSEGWLYLATIMDLYSRQVIGWSRKKNMECSLVKDDLSMAIRRFDPPFGSRQPVCKWRIPENAYAKWHHPKHEPKGQLLGQYADGELLSYLEDRVGPS